MLTSMSKMFYYCSSLTSIDLRGLDTSSVTTMENMFYYCDSLNTVYMDGLDLSYVSIVKNMFYSGSNNATGSLKLYMSGTGLKTMEYMFYNCRKSTIDLSDVDSSAVTNMNNMFYGCNQLTSLILTNLDTSSVNTIHQ